MKYFLIRIATVFFCLLNLGDGHSQTEDKLLKAEGKIPKEFITTSSDKYKKELATLKNKKSNKKTSRRSKKDKKRFLLESRFAIDDILHSGLVLFNDPITDYVTEVLNKLPIKDRKLKKKKPRIYVLNSAAVNAFATDQGIIFVTLGLLANLENEAQLAFILSHELIHIKNNHAINTFTKSKDIDRKMGKKGNIDQIAVDRKLFQKSLYSRKLEEEADEEGLEIFARSNYDPKAVLNTFRILHYSYLPYEEVPFDPAFFEDKNYIFPSNFKLEKVADLSPMEINVEKEKTSSHPSSIKRLEKLRSSVGNTSSANKKKFIIGEKKFLEIQKTARYQLPFLALDAENFPEAIYLSYLQLQENPTDLELKKVIGKALFMSAKMKDFYAGNELGTLESDFWEDIEGESQQIYHLLNKTSYKELLVLAMKYNWSLHSESSGDSGYQALMDDLFLQFAENYPDLDLFSNTNLPPPTEEEEVVEIINNTVDSSSTKAVETIPTTINYSKSDKIANANEKAATYWKYALVSELKKTDFKEGYKNGKKEIERLEDLTESLRNRKTRNSKALGINRLVVVNPFYLSIDARKKDAIQLIRTEEKQAYFRNALDKLSKTADLPTTLLDVSGLTSGDIEKFNDIAQINNYLNQQMTHYDMSLTPGYRQREINSIAEKYGTDYFLWTGVISLREKNKGAWLWVGGSLLLPYLLPITLPNAIVPKYDMLYYAILFDVKTGRRSVIKMEYFDKKDSKTILNAHIYDVFHQIKSKR